jgi:hypothetical protein
MSRYGPGPDERETRIARALLVQEYHPDDITALEYLADQSRADPFEVER